MIITELGIDQVNHADNVTITRVVFSDLSLNYVINPAGLTGVTGGNTASVEPTIGLLYNGTINLQAINNGNFSAQSAFIFAKNDEEFLIAVSPVSNNRVSGELSISKIRKLSFNALASDLVLKPEVNSVVASAMAELPHPDFNSIVDSAVSGKADKTTLSDYVSVNDYNSGLASKADTSTINDINNALDSKADTTSLSNYATVEVLTDVSSAITSELAKKADINALSNKADVATINDIKTTLSGKASIADLSNYYTVSDANDSFKSVDSALINKADSSTLQALSTSVTNNRNAMDSSLAQVKGGFDSFETSLTSASSHIAFLQSKADTDAGNIINNNKLINGLRDDLSTASNDSFKFRKVYTSNILDLANENDGAYEFYGNSAGGPADFYGYGVALKYHNTWNAVIVLFDNSTNLWTNRQGPGGWTGWRKVATTDMLDALTPTTSTVGKVDPSTVFRGYIEDAEFKLKDLDRPDGIYKVSTWISTKNCTDLPEGFYKDLGYTIQKTTIDDHTGIITVKGIKNMFQLTWLGLGTSWSGWIYSGIMG